MSPRAKILALLFFAALPALAEEAKTPCNLDAAAVIVCESGGRIFRVIREALSRSGGTRYRGSADRAASFNISRQNFRIATAKFG